MSEWLKGYGSRPYANVRAWRRKDGKVRYSAFAARSHRTAKYLGSFDDPESARIAVLEYQAKKHELIAAECKAEIEQLRRARSVA